jgi:hypothetical protein
VLLRYSSLKEQNKHTLFQNLEKKCINFALHTTLVLKHEKDETCEMCTQRNGSEEFLTKFGLSKLRARRPRDRRVAEWTVIELLKWILI